MNPYWSYLLTAVGVFGLWLAGRKDRRGWMVGIGAQTLWIAYATATHQWGFYISALAYGWVYVKNARAWKPKQGPYYATCDITGGCTWKSEACGSSEDAIKELDEHHKLFGIYHSKYPQDAIQAWREEQKCLCLDPEHLPREIIGYKIGDNTYKPEDVTLVRKDN